MWWRRSQLLAIRYRIHFEPVDVNNNKDLQFIKDKWKMLQESCNEVWGIKIPDFSRIITIDEHGFPLEELKQAE